MNYELEECPLCGHNTFDGKKCQYCKLDLSKQINKETKEEMKGRTIALNPERCPFCGKEVTDNFDADKVYFTMGNGFSQVVGVVPIKYHKSCSTKGR